MEPAALDPATPARRFATRAALEAFLGERRLPVLCVEPRPDRRAQQFVVAPWPAVVAELRAKPPAERRAHELLRGACRLFFDLEEECEADDDAVRRMDALVRLLDLAARRRLAAVFGLRVPPPLVLDGSRAGKQSRHLVFDGAAFEDARHVGAFVGDLVDELEAAGAAPLAPLDLGVYSPARSLRLPFCTGAGKGGSCFRARGDDRDAFDAETFLRGCVTAVVLAGEYGGETPPPPGVLVAPRLLRVGDGAPPPRGPRAQGSEALLAAGWAPQALREVARRLVALLHLRGMRPQRVFFSGDEASCLVRGARCPARGRPHRSNHVYAHLRLPPVPPRGDGWRHRWRPPALLVFVCPACGGARWEGGDVGGEVFEGVLSS